MKFAIAFLLAVGLTCVIAAPAVVSSNILKSLQSTGRADIILNMEQKTLPVLQSLQRQSFVDRAARLNSVAGSLKSISEASQSAILAFLAKQDEGIKVTSLWINNKISVKGATAGLIESLAAMTGVESITEDISFSMELPKASPAPDASSRALQWGVERVNAPGAWAQGFTGAGVVVGILDTGVRYTHTSLRRNWRESRGWMDAISGNALPTDGAGHGTHCIGSIVGLDGVGVAPDAQWIACRTSMAFTQVHYTELAKCAQFFLCPTNPDGSNPDCSSAPHLVSNSWGYHADMPGENFFDDVIPAWNAAGIIPVFAAGNEGSSCSTNRYPSNSDMKLITVGATDIDNNMATFSSRGPSASGLQVKPSISAPGVNIMSASSFSDDAFTTMSGTSMACPHTAGVIALLLSNGTDLSIAEVERHLYRGVTRNVPSTGRNCGGISETTYPNNIVGWGLLSATGAIESLLESRKQ